MSTAEALAGRYLVGDLLGTGGVASVHRARDLVLERDVAVKLFGPGIDPSGPERERAEMRTLANLTHPHLVTVYDAGTDGAHTPPRAYLVMALIDGPSLGHRLRWGPMAPETLRGVGQHMAEALAYVHSRDVIHRDVKPANILLDAAGTAYLADFGVAQTIGASALTATGMTVGTAAFLSPEQVRGETVGPATDVYALGLVLLEGLTGEREYTGSSAETAIARLSRPPRIAGRVPAAWQDLLTAMTQAEPADRPTAAEAATALRLLAADDQTQVLHEDRTQALDPGRTAVLAGPAPTQVLTRAAVAPTQGRPAPAARRLPTRAPGAPPARPWHSRRGSRLALVAVAGLVVLLVGAGLASSGSSVPQLSDPPAGAPGPDRLDADLARLQELVTP